MSSVTAVTESNKGTTAETEKTFDGRINISADGKAEFLAVKPTVAHSDNMSSEAFSAGFSGKRR